MGKPGRSPRPPSQTGTSTLASPKRRSLACSYEGGLRQVFRPSPAPPPSDGFRVRGGAPLTASANVCPHALFTCKSASTLCAATPLLVCLIDTYQKGRRNARYSALKYTICLAGKPSTGKPESAQSLEPQIELLVGTFSHELRLQYTSIFRISHCGNPRIQP